MNRRFGLAAISTLGVLGIAAAEDITFTPLSMRQGNTENRTGM